MTEILFARVDEIVGGPGLANPVTGDTLYWNGTQWTRLAAGLANQVLTAHGSATAPTWAAAPTLPPGGASLTVQYNNAGAFAGMSGTSWDDTNRALTLTGATVTTSNPVLNLSQTWNAGAVAFAGIRLNVTNTASAASSKLFDFQIGSTSRAWVTARGGAVFSQADDNSEAGFTVQSDNASPVVELQVKRNGGVGNGPYTYANNSIFTTGSVLTNGNPGNVNPAVGFWIGDAGGTTTYDTGLTRDAAGVFAQRNGANSQTFRVYSGFTDASNYSRMAINGNQLASEVAGTGSLAVTASTPVLNLAQTWNNAAVAFTGLKLNVTNTASAAASLLADLQVGGTSQVQMDKAGSVNILGTYWVGGFGTAGISSAGSGVVDFYLNGAFSGRLSTSAFNIAATQIGLNSASAPDVILIRDAAAILAQRNSTTAQTFRVYNTFTDASNYERGVIDWKTTANTLIIGSQAAGTGSGRDVQITSASGTITLAGASVGPQLLPSTGFMQMNFNGAGTVLLKNTGGTDRGLFAQNNCYLGFTGNGFGSTPTSGLSEVVAGGPIAFGNPSSAAGDHSVYFQWGGQARVTSDVTFTSTTTLATVTGLSVNVAAGRTYSFVAELSWTDAAAGGLQLAIAGTATATNIIYDGYIIDSAANGIKGNAQATALGTAVASSTTTGTAGHARISGTITVNAAGTLLVQAAQNTSNATATTIKRGSYFLVYDMP